MILKYAISRCHSKQVALQEATADVMDFEKLGFFEYKSGASRNCITVTMKHQNSNSLQKLKDIGVEK